MNTRTNVLLNDELILEAKKYATVKTKEEIVELALTEFINNRKRMKLSDLKGKIQFKEDYDYKQMKLVNKMVLVDTSVLIDYFKGIDNERTNKFQFIQDQNIEFGIANLIYLEILQGSKNAERIQ